MSKFLEASPLTALTNAIIGFVTRAFAGGLTTVPALVAWPGYALATIVIMMVSGMTSPISTTGFDSSNALGIIIAALVVLSLLLGSASLLRRWTTSHWGIETGALGGVFRLIGEANVGLRRTLIFTAGTVLGAAIISALAPNFRSFTAGVVYIAVLVIAAMLAIIITLAGRPHRGTAGVPMSVEDPLFTSLSAIFGQRNNDWIPGRVEVYENSQITVTPPSASGTWLANLTANVALHLSDWEIREASAAQVVLVPLSAATRENRELVASSAGLVTSVFPVPASIGTGKTMALKNTYDDLTDRHELERSIQQREGSDFTVSGFPLGHWTGSDGVRQGRVEVGGKKAQPSFFDAQEWTIVPTAKADALEAIAAREGRTLVEYVPAAGRAVVARLDPWTAKVRHRFAQELKIHDSEIHIRLDWTVDESSGGGRLDSVNILGCSKPLSDELVAKLMALVPEVSSGWTSTVDTLHGTATMTFGVARSLPSSASLFKVAESGNRNDPFTLPIGLSPAGDVINVNLRNGPHCLFVGPTGSGKSTLLKQYIGSALLRGFDVRFVDSAKGGVDFDDLEPYFSASAYSVRDAAKVISTTYVEVLRRKKLLKTHGVGFWFDLPDDVKRANRVVPIALVMDEYGDALKSKKPSAPRGTPLYAAQEDEESLKGTIRALSEKLATQARFVGIHLVVGIQTPSAEILGGEFRGNLTTTMQLMKPGTLPRPEHVRMVFSGGQADDVETVLTRYDDKATKGIGAIAVDGIGVEAIRVGFTGDSIPDYLDERGYKPVQKVGLLAVDDALQYIVDEGGDDEQATVSVAEMMAGLGGATKATAGPKRVVLPAPDQSVFNLWDAERAAESAPPAPLRPPGAPGALK